MNLAQGQNSVQVGFDPLDHHNLHINLALVKIFVKKLISSVFLRDGDHGHQNLLNFHPPFNNTSIQVQFRSIHSSKDSVVSKVLIFTFFNNSW